MSRGCPGGWKEGSHPQPPEQPDGRGEYPSPPRSFSSRTSTDPEAGSPVGGRHPLPLRLCGYLWLRAALGCPDTCHLHPAAAPGGAPARASRTPLGERIHGREERWDGAQTQAKRRNKSVHLPLPHPWTNPGAVKASCPRIAGAPGTRSQPWHVLALPGKGQCPSERSPAGRGSDGETRALRHRAQGTGHQHVCVQGGSASDSPRETPGPLASPPGPAGLAGHRCWEEGGAGGQAFLAKTRGDISGRSGNASLSFPGSL